MKFFNRENNWGFIRPASGGRDVFVHGEELVNATGLYWDEQVEFECIDLPGMKGPRAKCVFVVGGRR